MCKEIQLEVISTTRFDQNSDLTMSSLGWIDLTRASKIKAEGKFPVLEQGYGVGNVRYYWIQEQVNHLCPGCIIFGIKIYISYWSLHLKFREFK